MPPVSVLIKPASSSCNLQCRYCFYHDIAEKRSINNYGIMSADTLEEIVKKVLSEASGHCNFSFQGGEPTLAGLDFYKHLIIMQQKYNHNRCNIHNAIQTNGMVIDDGWAAFLSKHNFLVGISLDGPIEIHNQNRVDFDGNGSYTRVMKTIRILEKYKVEYNILYVVTSTSARHAEKIYSFFKKQNFRYLQFIPCLDPYGESRGKCSFSLTPDLYALFLKKTFDLWYADFKSGNMFSIRYFDNLVGMAAGMRPEACGMSGMCQCQFVIEADGSVYPCDFFVFDNYKIGNIQSNSFAEMFSSKIAQDFMKESAVHHPDCKQCMWYGLCRGGCRRDRVCIDADMTHKNYYCSAFKSFFEYSAPKIREAAMSLRRY